MTIGGESFVQALIQAGAQIGVKVTVTAIDLSREGLRGTIKTLGRGLSKLPGTPGGQRRGKMPIKHLQRLSRGDLHQQEVATEYVKQIQRDLKARGVDFAVEHAPDGKTYLHFKGADVDTISHALTQVAARHSLAQSQEQPDGGVDDRAQQSVPQEQPAPEKTITPESAPPDSDIVWVSPSAEDTPDAPPLPFNENDYAEVVVEPGVPLELSHPVHATDRPAVGHDTFTPPSDASLGFASPTDSSEALAFEDIQPAGMDGDGLAGDGQTLGSDGQVSRGSVTRDAKGRPVRSRRSSRDIINRLHQKIAAKSAPVPTKPDQTLKKGPKL